MRRLSFTVKRRLMADNDSKVWFITGSSRGFGRIWVEAALERGDRVAATARNLAPLQDLVDRYGDDVLPIEMDVTDRAAVDRAVESAHGRFGRLDVVVNNAGYGYFGSVEEVSDEESRAQFETNFFGALWVTKAVVPILREQGSGHLIQVSSIAGVEAFPGLGVYCASKWALEGLSQSLAAEVAPFGVHVTLVEPAGYSTDWAGDSAQRAEPIADYDHVREASAKNPARLHPGDPAATAGAMFSLVDSDQPPLRCFFGDWVLGFVEGRYADRLERWREWQPVAAAAKGGDASTA
jgi:NAD(P)-dependent dehydrogenase (short-subunit alcohol dehydrogenase family)